MLKMMQNSYEPSSSLQKSIARSDFSKKSSPLGMIPTTKLVTTKTFNTSDYDRRSNLDHLKPPVSNRMSPPGYQNENRPSNLTNRSIVNKPNLYNHNNKTQLANRPLNHQYNDNASAYSSSDTDSLRNKNRDVMLHDKLSNGNYDDDRNHRDHHDHHHHHHHHQPQVVAKVNRNYLLKMKKKYKYKISANVSGTKFDIGKCILVKLKWNDGTKVFFN
jgi:hypothetical protein